MNQKLRILVAAGGTAGHLAPALVVAKTLRDAGHEPVFAVSAKPTDRDLVQGEGFAVHAFAITGMPRKLGMAQLRAFWRALTAVHRSGKILREVRPNVVLAGGGFVAAPVAIAAWLRRIPVVATEADAHLGLANRISGRFAKRLCSAYPLPQFRKKQEVVGRPVSSAFRAESGDRLAARKAFDIPEDARVVAMIGGSGGATRLNEAAHAAWGTQSDPRVGDEELWVLHVAGRRDFPDIAARGISNDRYQLIEYCEDVPQLFAAADLVVSRPGGSVFELAAAGKAAILIPSPNVTADHQRKNAQWFVARGGGVMVEDSGIDGEHLRGLVNDLLSPAGDSRRHELAEGMKKLARFDAAERISEIVTQLGAAHQRKNPSVSATVVDTQVEASLPLSGRHIHFVGIGGAGVSALAQLAKHLGAQVDGCDQAESNYSKLVREAGIDVHIGHSETHVKPGTELVVSSALPKQHPELVRAIELDSSSVKLRGEFLGELTRIQNTVVVAGAHGKSTTTGMIAHAGVKADLDPSVALGATLSTLHNDSGSSSNVRAGSGPFIVEGDESDRTLLKLAAKIAVITNIERDHHHTFESDAEVEALFAHWAGSLGSDSVLIAGPGENIDRVTTDISAHVIRFGDDAERIEQLSEKLLVPGRHNALNALAAIEVLKQLGVSEHDSEKHVTSFPGIGRRFERVNGQDSAGVMVVDDYAHHPTEVGATIEAARGCANQRDGRVLVVFQPHLYSRTQALWAEFAEALSAADRVWVLPLFGAREQPIDGVSETLISDRIVDRFPEVYAGRGTSDPATGAIDTILEEASQGDVLITMGAGSVTKLAPRIWQALSENDAQGDVDS